MLIKNAPFPGRERQVCPRNSELSWLPFHDQRRRNAYYAVCMRPRHLASMAARMAALCALSLALRAGEAPTFRSGVTLVKAETYVFDRDTKAPIRGLTAHDFSVFD